MSDDFTIDGLRGNFDAYPEILAAADEIERLRAALVDMAQDWCCRLHPNDTHVEVLMPVELFKEFRDE